MKVLLLISLLLISCTSSKKVDINTISSSGKSKIFFVVMKISKNPALGKTTIALISSTPVAGKLKNTTTEKIHTAESLTLDVFERDSLAQTIVITHPLFKHVEYTNESSNALTAKDITLDSADFFVRLELSEHSSRIRISETLPNKPTQELSIIQL